MVQRALKCRDDCTGSAATVHQAPCPQILGTGLEDNPQEGVWKGGGGSGQAERGGENSNSKTLFYKDCSLGSFKNLSNN